MTVLEIETDFVWRWYAQILFSFIEWKMMIEWNAAWNQKKKKEEKKNLTKCLKILYAVNGSFFNLGFSIQNGYTKEKWNFRQIFVRKYNEIINWVTSYKMTIHIHNRHGQQIMREETQKKI